MNWDQIENNWAAMTRRVRPATGTPNASVVQPSGIVVATGADWPERTATSTESAIMIAAARATAAGGIP